VNRRARAFGALLGVGLGLVVTVGVLGGRGAVVGGAVAVAAQVWAVALLQPVMGAPNPAFMARWLGGMVIRVVALGLVITIAATNRATLPLLPAALGFLGVLLPLLFLETRFLK
jgi:hypothetical protein